MVHKVDNRSSVTAAYESTARKRKRSETDAPAFLLGEDDGVVWDRSDKKEKAKPRKEETVEVKQPEVKTEAAAAPESSFDIHSIISKIRDRIRTIFDRALKVLWYGEDEKKEDTQQQKKAAPVTEEETEDMKLLHNTSILTCYDKKGNLTKMESPQGKKTYRQHI